tara:strand:+ start:4465 stop:5631 length:1167 start_codon:yes stop_codon:yes gene_type:complete
MSVPNITDHPVIKTLSDLVSINSVNPEWGGPGEAEVAAYVRKFFEEAGVEVREEEVLPGRSNVLARVPGKDRSRSLLFEAHMDTVTVEGMTIEPFEPRIEGNLMWGRGSCDVKAGLAAMMQAVVGVANSGHVPPQDLILAAVVDEEHEFRGVTHLINSLETMPAGAVVAEPTQLEIATANKGVLRWRILAHGKSAHSSKPDLGASAITAMADVVKAFDDDNTQLALTEHPLVGAPTCNIGTIQGGDQVNFVPALCVIKIDRRLIPGEVIEDVAFHYERMIREIESKHDGVRFEIEPSTIADAAMETSVDERIVGAAGMTADEQGLGSRPIGVPFGCDCTKLSRAGIPSIIFGPGSIDQAHTADEFVNLREVEQACDFLQAIVHEFGRV